MVRKGTHKDIVTMIPRFRHKTQFLGHNGAVFSLEKGLDNTLYSCGSDAMLVRWPFLEQNDGILHARTNSSIYSSYLVTDRNLFLLGNMEGRLQWIENGEERFHFKAHKKGIFAFCDIGDRFISLGGDGKVGVWDWSDPKNMFLISLSEMALRSVAADEESIYIGGSDGNIYILDKESLDLKNTIPAAHGNSVFTLCVSSDGKYLFSGSRDMNIKKWSLEDMQLVHLVPAHAATVNHIILGPQGCLISAGRDKEIRIWTEESMQLKQVLKAPRDNGHINSVNRLLWDEANGYLFSTGDDKSIICWEVFND